jgi:hypothetical protein
LRLGFVKIWQARQGSNLQPSLRRLMLYPLSYAPVAPADPLFVNGGVRGCVLCT